MADIRYIVFNGYNTREHGVLIDCEKSDIGELTPRRYHESVPYMDGDIEFTFADGQPHYEPREPSYRFIFHGTSRQDILAKYSQMKEAFSVNCTGVQHLYDSDVGIFTGATAKGFGKMEWSSRNFRIGFATVTFSTKPKILGTEVNV